MVCVIDQIVCISKIQYDEMEAVGLRDPVREWYLEKGKEA